MLQWILDRKEGRREGGRKKGGANLKEKKKTENKIRTTFSDFHVNDL